MKKKINREALDFYIYNWGYEKALDYFNLTDQQAENILFSKPINKGSERIRKKKDKPLIGDTETIYKVIEDNYNEIRKAFIRYNRLDVININSENPEDKFHNALIKIVEDLSRFNFIDEEKTIGYIKTRCYFEKLTDDKKVYKLQKEFIKDDNYLNNLENENDTDNN